MSSYTKQSANRQDRFIRFENAEGKAWVVPIKSMRTALNLYQPSGAKGKAVKSLLPYLYWLPQLRTLIKAESRQITLDGSLKSLLCRVLNVDDFEFSIFEGTPSVHQKVTIQISKGDQIIAYCKLTESEDVKPLFRHEEQILSQLHSKGIDNIPKCLYCGELSEGSRTLPFVQSTIKTNRSKVIHSWSDEHWKFLDNLHSKTKIKLPFAESDFAKSLVALEDYLPSLPEDDRCVIIKSIEHVRIHYSDSDVEFSAYHADFTPWNMFFESGKLFVFDFEYAALTYPPYLDWFHYFTQCCILKSNMNCSETYNAFRECCNSVPIKNIEQIYKQYLLCIISFYLVATKGKLSSTDRCYLIWIELLKKML